MEEEMSKNKQLRNVIIVVVVGSCYFIASSFSSSGNTRFRIVGLE